MVHWLGPMPYLHQARWPGPVQGSGCLRSESRGQEEETEVFSRETRHYQQKKNSWHGKSRRSASQRPRFTTVLGLCNCQGDANMNLAPDMLPQQQHGGSLTSSHDSALVSSLKWSLGCITKRQFHIGLSPQVPSFGYLVKSIFPQQRVKLFVSQTLCVLILTAVLVSHGCDHELGSWKQHRYIILQFWRSEVGHRSHGLTSTHWQPASLWSLWMKVHSSVPAPRNHLPFLAHGPSSSSHHLEISPLTLTTPPPVTKTWWLHWTHLHNSG